MYVTQSIVRRNQSRLELLGRELGRDIQKRPKYLRHRIRKRTTSNLDPEAQNERYLHQRSQLAKLTCKKLSTEASSHIDRMVHRGNCDGGGVPNSGVTILLHCSFCCGDSSCRCSFFLGLLAGAGAAAAWSRAAARMVHARDGRLLLLTGGAGAASFCGAGVSFLESGFRVWLSGEVGRSLGIGGGEGSGDMVLVEIRRV